MTPDQPGRRPEDDLAERDRAAEADDQYAHARDLEADDDDQEAAAHDVIADERDADAEQLDPQAQADRAPDDRHEAGEDRQLAAEDRDRARGDRTAAEHQRHRAGEDRGAADGAVAELRGLLLRAEDDAEAARVITQAQDTIMTAPGKGPLQALLVLAMRAAEDRCELQDAARSILAEAAK